MLPSLPYCKSAIAMQRLLDTQNTDKNKDIIEVSFSPYHIQEKGGIDITFTFIT